MRRSRLVLLLMGALAAPTAWAATQTGSWTNGCQAGQTTKSLHGGQFACYNPATGASTSSASPIIDVNSCENVDIFLYQDRGGTGAADCTVTWTIQTCPVATLANDTARDNACNTLLGTAALTGDDVESNLAPAFLRVVGGGAGANIDSCQIVVHCALDAQK